MEALNQNEYYTYSDYLTWDDKTRYELIEGVPYVDGIPFKGIPAPAILMAPAPLRIHQKVSGEIFWQLKSYLKGKPCEVYNAPFDVRLNADGADDTVVQPDLLVVCDHSKLDDNGCVGAPDMIIEILSPSTARRDKFIKIRLYQRAGVREYWIVDPDSKTASVHILENSKYIINAYGDTDTVPVHVLEGCQIDLHDVFDF